MLISITNFLIQLQRTYVRMYSVLVKNRRVLCPYTRPLPFLVPPGGLNSPEFRWNPNLEKLFYFLIYISYSQPISEQLVQNNSTTTEKSNLVLSITSTESKKNIIVHLSLNVGMYEGQI